MTRNRMLLCAAGALLLLASCAAPKSAGYRVYVTNEVSGDLSVIDGETMKVIANVPLGKRPRGIRASADGKTIYVALSGTPIGGPNVDESTLPPPDKSADGIGVFDVASNKMIKTIHGGSDPENFDLSKDGKLLYISNEDVAGMSILDLAAEKVVGSVRTGEEPEGVRTSPDGRWVWVTSEDEGTVAVVTTESAKLDGTIKVGRRPRNVAFTPDGKLAWVNAENDGSIVLVDAIKREVVKTVALGEPGVIKPMFVLLSKDAAKLYVSSGRGGKVFIVDTATANVDASIAVGRRPWGMALSPDGKRLFTANGPSNDVSVVDLASNAVIQKVPVTGGPWGAIALAQ